MRKRARFILSYPFILLFLFLFARYGRTSDIKVKVTADEATIRLNPLEESKVLATVPKDMLLDLLEISGDWYRIQLRIEPEGIVISGFVHKSEVRVTEQTLPEETEKPERPELKKEVSEKEEEPGEEILKIIVTAEKGDVRVEPHLEGRILGQAPRETSLESPGKTDKWYKVYIIPGNTELIGFIHESQVLTEEEYAKLTPAEKPEEPEEKIERVPVEKTPAPEIKPPGPSAAAAPGKLYFKGSFGFGGGFDEVSLYLWAEAKDEIKEVFQRTGGGAHIQGAVGYEILPFLLAEIGIGYQMVSENPTVKDADGSFTKAPISFSMLYKFFLDKPTQVYIGVGGDVYLGPRLYRKGGGLENIVNYSTAIGFHGIAGLDFRPTSRLPFYVFMELMLTAGVYHKYTKHTEGGIPVAPFTEWREFHGDQFYIIFGFKFSPKFKSKQNP